MGTSGQHPLPLFGRITGYPTRNTRAPGDRWWMPCRTAATFGPVRAIAAASWSVPPEVYWSLHGELNGLRTLSSAHVVTMSAKPMSLPPICTVTSDVPVVRALNCGGLVPSGTDSEPSMSVVSAPWQLMSWNEEGASAALTRDG